MSEVDRFTMEMSCSNHKRCVSCGVDVPEDSLRCPTCERKHKAKAKHVKQTICWECSKLDCPWMQDAIPVKNWIAEPSVIKDNNGDIKSYCVIHCPLYERSKKKATIEMHKNKPLTKVYAICNKASGLYLKNSLNETMLFSRETEARSYIDRNLEVTAWDAVEYKE